MSDLTAFLNARLNEDHWEAFKFHNDSQWDAEMLGRLFGLAGSDPIVHHVARYDPARALREVEAGRAILGLHVANRYGDCSVCVSDRSGYIEEWGTDTFPCNTLRHLAAIWSAHPDYQPEWAPS